MTRQLGTFSTARKHLRFFLSCCPSRWCFPEPAAFLQTTLLPSDRRAYYHPVRRMANNDHEYSKKLEEWWSVGCQHPRIMPPKNWQCHIPHSPLGEALVHRGVLPMGHEMVPAMGTTWGRAGESMCSPVASPTGKPMDGPG